MTPMECVSVVLFKDAVKKSSEMVHATLCKFDLNFVNKEKQIFIFHEDEQQALL